MIYTSTHRWRCWVWAVFLIAPLSAYPQTMLTGAIQFSTNSTGAASGGLLWNTLGGDTYYDLWLAQNANATSPVNGPADAQANIAVPLDVGKSYTFYIFGQPGPGVITGFNGLNLFFDGNNSAPAISVFGPTNTSSFLPDSASTLALQGTDVAGAARSFYSYGPGDAIAVLAGYGWNLPATPPGDVCQSFAFSPAPGDVADYYGSFTLQVFPAAALSLSDTSASPFTKITLTGSGFAPTETVEIYAGHIGAPPLFTMTTTDASGAFTVSAREPQHPYGPMDVYAVGVTSHKLGAASLSVTPVLIMNPATGTPGATTVAYSYGFGSGETVDIYWNNPRQLLGMAAANAEGSATLTIAIPSNAPPGINVVIGIGQTTKALGIGGVTVQ